ncbi:MAG TPA: hypothetical protein VF956_06060 [Candidatus Dormibacteraeota bacterium]
MHPFMNEDAAWQRLQDIQREMENRRLTAAGRRHITVATLRQLAARAWLLAGLAAMRPPRRRPVRTQADGERRSRIA